MAGFSYQADFLALDIKSWLHPFKKDRELGLGMLLRKSSLKERRVKEGPQVKLSPRRSKMRSVIWAQMRSKSFPFLDQ
ncbi:hypothetical protein JHK87_038872 [Glycine soja]|nr:hypothetical protein JHK87_038872 [Glycine soja]